MSTSPPHIFGAASLAQLATCDPRLQRIANEAIKYGPDFSIVEGFRNQAMQHRDYLTGKSKLDWPNGRHNHQPSLAYDFSPYPEDWSEGQLPHARFAMIAGVHFVVAAQLGIDIRWGADWNRNLDPRDETFLDWGHIELVIN
jgi:peptidoglycan LD-endopeptidase CwlK